MLLAEPEQFLLPEQELPEPLPLELEQQELPPASALPPSVLPAF